MAEANETRAFYRAIVDFNAIKKETLAAERALNRLKDAESKFNAASAKDRAAATKASVARSKALASEVSSIKTSIAQAAKYASTTRASTVNTRDSTRAIQSQNRALLTNAQRLLAASEAARAYSRAQKSITGTTGPSTASVKALQSEVAALKEASAERSRHTDEIKEEAAAVESARKANVRFVDGVGEVNEATGEVTQSVHAQVSSWRRLGSRIAHFNGDLRNFKDNFSGLPPILNTVRNGGDRLYRSLQKFGNWRPRLTPPFVALIPIIGAAIAAINPLLALIGSAGPVILGFASQIGSLSGAFLALPGILSGVAAGIGSVIASMGGVGNVFKTYSAMQKATNSAAGGTSTSSGPTGRSQEERTEALSDAERSLEKAQRSVTKAQENLNDARQEALRDLIDLREEVSRASLNEERAIANLRRAQEEYWNVMADPGSTLGDKLDAAASIKEAEADLEDVRKTNIKNQNDLAVAEKKGIENAENVVDAREALVDAIEAQSDAERALRRERSGANDPVIATPSDTGMSAQAQAQDEFNRALAELSPSARTFVLAIIAMQDQWKAFRRDMQETFFSQFVDDLDKLPKIVDNLGNFLRPAAREMGRFTGNLITLLASPEWSRDLKTIGDQNGEVIEDLGEGFLSIADALKDITIAAGPFTDWMTTGFAEGAQNFSDFIADARETGSLARWLEDVQKRLERWWQIIKNVGATLFNYSAASSEFGDWISEGLLDLTESWKEASEAAREEGSPFQQYLEDVKPLLTEVKGLFGDFFSWLADEMMDPENIQDAQDLVKLLREDLGPAIGRLLDTLAETDIDEKFISALTSIVESIDTILENGGSAAFEAFFGVVSGFFEVVAGAISKIDKSILQGLLGFLGVAAGVAFVGKFTGLTSLLGLLAGFKTFKWGGISGFFAGLGKLGGRLGWIGGVISLLTILSDVVPALSSMFEAGPGEGAAQVDDKLKNDPSTLLTRMGFGDRETSTPLGWLEDLVRDMTPWGNEFSRYLDELATYWYDFGADLIRNWDAFWAGVEKIWNTWSAPFRGDWDTFWSGVQNLASFILDKLGIDWDLALGALNTAWTTFTAPFRGDWDTFWGGVHNTFSRVLGLFGIDWNKTWLGIQIAFRTLTAPLRGDWDTFWTGLSTILSRVLGNFGINWSKTWNGIRGAWRILSAPLRGDWDSFWGGMRSGFDTILRGITKGWETITDKFRRPVKVVVETVYNNGIRTFWNTVNDSLGLNMSLPRVRFAKGGVMPGYTPGRDVHEFYSPTAGRLSLSGGEAIMRPEFTKMMGGKAGIDELNKRARRGQAFAFGGVYGDIQGNVTKGVGRPTRSKRISLGGDTVDRASSSPLDLFLNPAKYVSNGLKNLIAPMMDGIGGGNWGQMVSKFPVKLVNSLASKVDSLWNALPGGGGPGNALGWSTQWNILRNAFPGASLFSAFRPGAMTSTGVRSYHAQGRAVDVTPSMEIFNWIRRNFPNSRELIYSPAGPRQLMNGANYYWGEPVRSDHWDHVHWAMKNGGVIPKLYDNGGWIPNGGAAINLSGKPEAVLDPQESRALKSLISGSGLSGSLPSLGSRAAVLSSSGVQPIYDYSVNVQELKMINPVPEKPSVSLPKAIRQIGYMNNARSEK
jgi:phage-related protein